jgi:cell division cycle 14
MVVGPQQHWLHLNQGTFREWWFEDTLKQKILASMPPATPTRLQQRSTSRRVASNGQTFTPPNAERHTASPRRALGEITNNEAPVTAIDGYSSTEDLKNSLGVADENLPAPTPGQPRKTNKIYGGRRVMTENQPFDVKPDSGSVSVQRTRVARPNESEDEYALRMLARKASQSPVSRSGKRRAVSCTTTTTTTTKWDVPTDNSDSENRPETVDEMEVAPVGATPSHARTPGARSGSGVGSLSIGKRSSPIRRSTEGKTSVRKTSGRIGSVGGPQALRAQKSS